MNPDVFEYSGLGMCYNYRRPKVMYTFETASYKAKEAGIHCFKCTKCDYYHLTKQGFQPGVKHRKRGEIRGQGQTKLDSAVEDSRKEGEGAEEFASDG